VARRKKKSYKIQSDHTIECVLREQLEWGSVISAEFQSKRRKFGWYHGSYFAIPEFGRTLWVVGVEISVDYSKYLEEGLTEQEIFGGCVNYLNKPPPRKRKPLYGVLEAYRYQLKKDEGGLYISALLTINQKKNKHFWGKGKIVPLLTRRRKS